MDIEEAEKRIKALEDEVVRLKGLIGRPSPPSKRYIEAIGKPFPGKGEVHIPTVED